MERLILDCSIRFTLLVLGAWLLTRALRLASPSLQHRLFVAALTAALLLPAWTQFGPTLAAPVLPSEPQQQIRGPVAAVGAIGPTLPLPAPATTPRRVSATAPAPVASIPLAAIALAIYLAGAALMLARLIRATLRVRALLRSAQPHRGFFVSADCAAPIAAGWLRPVLLLPESFSTWSAAKLDAVLLHEREHMRRRDPLIQWLALLNRALFWFHPLAWWLERRLATLAEDSCDAAVLVRGVAPADYAGYLIEIARNVTASGALVQSAAAIPFASANLPRRIRRILDAPGAPSPSPARSIAAGLLCALLFSAFLACRPTRRDPSMAAQAYQSFLESRGRAQENRDHSTAITNASGALTPQTARALAAEVEAHPDDPDKLAELRGYYELHHDATALDAQTLWFIEHHPEVRTVWEFGYKGPEVRSDWGYHPAWDNLADRVNYPAAVALWRTQLAKTWNNPTST